MANKFSYYITELSKIWWEWMKADGQARDSSICYKKRKKFAMRCEELISKEYKIIDGINSLLEKVANEQK